MKKRSLKLRCFYILLLLGVLVAGACSDGELEGDLYPVSPDKGGNGGGSGIGGSPVIEGLMESMVRIPGGTFLMGSEVSEARSDESPSHPVTLDAFYISRYTVTQRLWKEIMGTEPSTVKYSGATYYYEYDYPVTNVSYSDCLEFIRKLNGKTGKQFTLPTEAQWELAARGRYSQGDMGDEYSSSSYYYVGNSSMTLHIVGSDDGSSAYSNSFRLYHMSGNVKEWVADWYGKYPSEAQDNPEGPSSGKYRIFRGGSCASSREECRVTARASNLPSMKADDCSFRLVMNGLMNLQVSPLALNFSRDGGKQKVTVTAEKGYYGMSSEPTWCRVAVDPDDKNLTVDVEPNKGKSRTAKITIKASSGEDEVVILLTQAGYTFELLYNGKAIDTLMCTYPEKTAELTVQAPVSVAWRVSSSDDSWLDAQKNGSSVKLIIRENDHEYYSRTGYVLLETTSSPRMTDTVWVVQKRRIRLALYMGNDQVKYLTAKNSGGYADIRVATNAVWEAVSDASDWCHLSDLSDGFRITIDALSDKNDRQTFVAVDAEGMKDTIWVNQKATPQVGGLFDRNGVKGIIWEVNGDRTVGMIVSLQESSAKWSSRYSASNGRTYANDQSDGRKNFNVIRKISDWNSYYPAFYECHRQGDGWYLPALGESKALFSAIRSYGTSKFDRVLRDNGGQEFSSASTYWCSTEVDYEWAYGIDKGGSVKSDLYKYNNYRVRAIRRVTFE